MAQPLMPREVLGLLRSSGRSWAVESGKRHHKLRVEGRLVLVLPHSSASRFRGRREANAMSTLRRALSEAQP